MLPQAHASFVHGISPVFGAWGFNLAAFGHWWLVEQNIGQVIFTKGLELNRLVDPAEVLESGFVPEPADKGTYTAEQPGEGVFIGLVWSLIPDYRYIYPIVVQAIVDSLACGLAFLLASRL